MSSLNFIDENPSFIELIHITPPIYFYTFSFLIVVKVGAALISFVLDSAKTEKDTPAFLYTKKLLQKGTYKRVGMLMLDESQYLDIASKEASSISPRHLPMLVPPKLWDNLKTKEGCYFRLRSSIMRTISNFQTDALRRAKIEGILQGLDYLGDDVSFYAHS